MKCRTCKQPIPDALLACPTCVERRCQAETDRVQLEGLRKVAEGTERLTLRQNPRGVRHIQRFAADVAFCGAAIIAGHERTFIAYNTEALNKACSACRIEVQRLMTEAVCQSSAS